MYEGQKCLRRLRWRHFWTQNTPKYLKIIKMQNRNLFNLIFGRGLLFLLVHLTDSFKKIQFSWKICKNFSFACHSERKNGIVQKISTPQSGDGQIIWSVHCREQNGKSSFSILPVVWASDPREWNFSVSSAYFWNEISWILAKLLILDKNVKLKSCRSSKNNGSLFRVLFL